ncbi:MAG: AAA family ATPase [Deltaproteobacteria bacterium]|nr:AAA family ATPase [Deltaproteobacteria bacterium]MCL5276720.1 AAA family ATPase [Deltaproteobacteria bacterium]
MITKLKVENFKQLSFDLELDPAVAFVGPNNSGKTSALQAIALWYLAVQKWSENIKTTKAKKRIGVPINRRDLISLPTPSAKFLWKYLQVRKQKEDKTGTQNILIKIYCDGISNNQPWKLGFEFDYANEESFYCRIFSDPDTDKPMEFPEAVLNEKVGFLPPMSGLASEEDKLQPGSINSRIGEGRTAEVLRNLCWLVHEQKNEKWNKIKILLDKLFKIRLNDPEYFSTTGKLALTYKEHDSTLDISNVGRGFQQILLLIAYIYSQENKILLIDEPDAHLEVLRQKEIYNLLSDNIKKENAQLIIATHSEAVLSEVSEKDQIIAFIGTPHTVNNKSQLVKALTAIGFDQYLLAKQKGWVLYLEGSTNLDILKAFAKKLRHPTKEYLENAFVKYVANVPSDTRSHFFALKEAEPSFIGVAIFDRLETTLQNQGGLNETMWSRREIENYILLPDAIYRFFDAQPRDLFNAKQTDIIKAIVEERTPPIALKDTSNDWWINTKISDDILDKLFREFYKKINQPIQMRKGNYYQLIDFMKPEEINDEVKEKLDLINSVAKKAEQIQEK